LDGEILMKSPYIGMLAHSQGQELAKSIINLLQSMRKWSSRNKFSSYNSFNLPIDITKMYNPTHVKILPVSTEPLYLMEPNPTEHTTYS
jgi:hypothetical protein